MPSDEAISKKRFAWLPEGKPGDDKKEVLF
jgi:hypothetical protein